MSEFYYFFLMLLWALSGGLMLLAVYKNKVISLFDIFVFLSWFYVFYRPLLIDYCDVYRDLYFWNEKLYIYGVFYVGSLLVLMQFGASFVRSPSQKDFKSIDFNKLKVHLFNIVHFAFLISFVIVVVAWLEFGSLLLPFNRGGGALSVSVPGLEKYFYVLRVTTLFLITVSLFLFFVYGSKKAILYFLFGMACLLIFSKRGAVLSPIFFFIFLYTFYILKIKKKSYVSFIDGKTVGLLLFIVLVTFVGKIIFEPEKILIATSSDQTSVCKVIHAGQQEFDLFTPAVIEFSSASDVFDLPTALFGGLIEHRDRLLNYSKSFHSATDKLMMEVNADVYLNKKFGISPNIFQYLIFYFSLFSIFLVLFIGYAFKFLEKKVLLSFYKRDIFKSYLFLILMKFLMSPHDFTFKYYVFQLVVFIFVVFMYSIYMALLRGIKGCERCSVNL